MQAFAIDAWIRINQLGYLPNAPKKAVFISETPQVIKQFSIHDALTNKELAVFSSVISQGEFENWKSSYILDFSSFQLQGAFYIQAGLFYSPTIYINKNIYLGTADFLLNFLREQRFSYSPVLDTLSETHNIKTSDFADTDNSEKYNSKEKRSSKTKTLKSSKETAEVHQPDFIDVRGGWRNAEDVLQFGSISANTVFQLLLAYQLNPSAFADKFDAVGKHGQNNIPDILDEAKWGMDWLLKMFPDKERLYFQVGDDKEVYKFAVPFESKDKLERATLNSRPVFQADGNPETNGIFKNRTNGIASIAGKFASAFALGAILFDKINPVYADSLASKAEEAYELGQKYPGVCQSVPSKNGSFQEEQNWSDDMELAAAELYRLTYKGKYLQEAAGYGRMEPVSPWLCSDTAKNYQWYPYLNVGHYLLANVENPRYRNEFIENLKNGIERMGLQSKENPFNVGVPLITNSNNLIVALASQCRLYRTITNDSTFIDMENSLVDWLFGCNPWGSSMITGLPKTGKTPFDPVSAIKDIKTEGGLVNGPVLQSVFDKSKDIQLSKSDGLERFQTDWGVYHDDRSDFITNEPTLDGTASLAYLLSVRQNEGVGDKTTDKNEYDAGGIIRTDTTKKQICLVFTGNEFGDGFNAIFKTLKRSNVKASFFFTGNFYRNRRFAKIIKELKKDNQFLGAASDRNLTYCSSLKRDSIFINKSQFINDLRENFNAMEKFEIEKNASPFFLPPNGCYNDSVSCWCSESGLHLINFTPGTLSYADNTYPEMRSAYYSSIEIYNRIMQMESKQGLNGAILVFHLGTDKRRQDKFYPRLQSLIIELARKGYMFVDLYKATDALDKPVAGEMNKNKKKKN
jgi:peptidoglycan/xylan/chitin deacetylase (PgdA/CDA1 family)